jgi:hypothetical protein
MKRLYYHRHKARLREKTNAANLARTRQQRARVLEVMGGRCVRCGFSDWRALQIDHINGGGRVDRELYANKDQYLRAVLRSLEKYQLLCANCNWIKKYERGEHRWANADDATPSLQMALD